MERVPTGIVLTAGSQTKESPIWIRNREKLISAGSVAVRTRIEPDLEGKLRLLAALTDLQSGLISRLIVAGGAKNNSVPLARIYCAWLDRYANMGKIYPHQIIELKGGVNTETDLNKAKQKLKKESYSGNLRLYSSGYHFERKSIDTFKKHFPEVDISTTVAEIKIQERRPIYGQIMGRILTPEHIANMRARNRKMDRMPQFALNLGAYILRR